MSWASELSDLMVDEVVIQGFASVSTDGYGRAVYGSASTYTARYVHSQQLVRTFAGTEELSNGHAWVLSTSTFDPSSKVTVNGVVTQVMAASQYPDETGRDHLKIFFG